MHACRRGPRRACQRHGADECAEPGGAQVHRVCELGVRHVCRDARAHRRAADLQYTIPGSVSALLSQVAT